jgi:hypothetical protein
LIYVVFVAVVVVVKVAVSNLNTRRSGEVSEREARRKKKDEARAVYKSDFQSPV